MEGYICFGIPLCIMCVACAFALRQLIMLSVIAAGPIKHIVEVDELIKKDTYDPQYINKVEFETSDVDELCKYLKHIIPLVFHPKKTIKIIQPEQTRFEVIVTENYLKGFGKIDPYLLITTKKEALSQDRFKDDEDLIYKRCLLLFSERPTWIVKGIDKAREITIAFKSKSIDMIVRKVHNAICSLPAEPPEKCNNEIWESYLEYQKYFEKIIVPNMIKAEIPRSNIKIGFRVESLHYYRNNNTHGNFISISFCPVRI